MARKPRPWHVRFIRKYTRVRSENFLLVACPAAGKTYAAASVARDLLDSGEIDRILVLVRDVALRKQWHDAFREFGIWIDYDTMNDPQGERREILGHRCQGWVVTYASVMMAALSHRLLNGHRKTMVILDEIHHLGDDASWGKAAVVALEPCVRRLGLSGTPFRGNDSRIPFVEYETVPDKDGLYRCRYKDADGIEYSQGFDYDYGTALTDDPAPVRPLIFQIYDGDATWLQEGELFERNAVISDTLNQKMRAKVRRHSLNAAGAWLRNTLVSADQRLSAVRAEGDPQAKGVIFCMDTKHANEVFFLLGQIAPGQARIAVSKDADGNDVSKLAADIIEAFKTDEARWIVTVRMVSEGVDIPRLRVGVYATTAVTELMFRQVAGRIVRKRDDLPEDVDQTAYFFIPKDPDICALADGIAAEVKGALLNASDETISCGGFDEDGDNDDRERLRDQFIASNQGAAEVMLPGAAPLDPALVTRVALAVGDGEASAARHLVELAKMGLLGNPQSSSASPVTPEEEDYKKQIKRAQGVVVTLVKQITDRQLKREYGGAYPQEAFSERVKVTWGLVKNSAEITDWKRADLPALITARQAAAKMLGDL